VRPGYGLYFTITTTGSPFAVVTESGTLPPGLGFQAFPNGTAVIQGLTPAGAGGSYTVTITASNGVAPDAVQQLVISFATTTTTTSLSALPNPSVGSQEVTYTAKVAPVPNGGDMTISANGTNIPGCVNVAVSASTGAATCSRT
jgi:hypothetical protein